MKMIIITGKGGTIVGTARQVEGSKPEAGHGGPIAGPGQSIHVIDVPKELEGIEDASELHRKLKVHLDAKGKLDK
jgi:hypothetical protein